MIKAYAKVNLKLKILKKMPNNYHKVDMINIKISMHDSIYIKESKLNDIRYSNYTISKEKDTLYIMLCSLQKKFPNLPKFSIYIKKRIPVGAGLGGMSSDAASILNYINKQYQLGMSIKDKIDFVLGFGTDMVYCLYDCPANVKGIGEKVYPINIALPKKIIIINPNIYISTADMYKDIDNYNYNENNELNDFEWVARKKNPELDEIFNKIRSICKGQVQMSGSGSSIYVLNFTKKEYKLLKKVIKECVIKIYKIRKGIKNGKFN